MPPKRSLDRRKPKRTPQSKPTKPPSDIPTQQSLLDLFRAAFPDTIKSPTFASTLQSVKALLYARSYVEAFSKEEYREAYVLRWSPGRALCYAHVFEELCPELRAVFSGEEGAHEKGVDEENNGEKKELVFIGGGAGAEIIGAAGALKKLGGRRANISVIDISDWSLITSALSDSLSSFLPLSLSFTQRSILSPNALSLLPTTAKLITLMFTTNELYAQSRKDTTLFLLELGERVQKGCLLLVLESAGSYSEVKVGEKVFKMEVLLEHTLCMGEDPKWEVVLREDSRWFRCRKEELRYPVPLEDMRFSVRLFRRT